MALGATIVVGSLVTECSGTSIVVALPLEDVVREDFGEKESVKPTGPPVVLGTVMESSGIVFVELSLEVVVKKELLVLSGVPVGIVSLTASSLIAVVSDEASNGIVDIKLVLSSTVVGYSVVSE